MDVELDIVSLLKYHISITCFASSQTKKKTSSQLIVPILPGLVIRCPAVEPAMLITKWIQALDCNLNNGNMEIFGTNIQRTTEFVWLKQLENALKNGHLNLDRG